MIAHLCGTVLRHEEGEAVIEVGGVGYLVIPSPTLVPALVVGESCCCPTLMVVREDAMHLYAFASWEERAFFAALLSVPGVGPKSALAIVGSAPLPSLQRAVHEGDAAPFARVAGIGKKTAQKILLELKGRVLPPPEESAAPTTQATTDAEEELVAALQTLGYRSREARALTAELPPETLHLPLEERLREALRRAGRPPASP